MSDTDSTGGKPSMAAKAEKLADDAVVAGRKFVETDTGKKVADLTDSAFDKAEALRQEAVASEFGRKALDSNLGKQAVEFVEKASEQTKKVIPNTLGRNMAVGAAAGAVVALPLPFIGSFLGALVGAGLGYLRTITKQP